MKLVLTERQMDKVVDNLSEIENNDARILGLMNLLKNTVNEIPNTWDSKKRESFVFEKLKNVDFVIDGTHLLSDKKLKKTLEEIYNGTNPLAFSTNNLIEYDTNIEPEKFYAFHEPFGSKKSPDFLFITPKGMIGVEDKSSKNEKISWNTGTPGSNKFIMYYDRKHKKVFLITGSKWGWDQQIEDEYRKFTEEIRVHAASEFEKRFGSRLKNMAYYARPMLIDKNKIKDIVDKDEKDVIEMLRRLI
jgi:hypothetical protein